MKRISILLIVVFLSTSLFAQNTETLTQMRQVAEQLRTAKGNAAKHKQAVSQLAADRFDRITLMDDLEADDKSKEDHSTSANPFRFDAVIGYVYKIKQGYNVSKQIFYDSKEKGIHYSAIEKTVKPNTTVSYTLREHSGKQEFIIVPFDVKAKFSVTINGKQAQRQGSNLVCTIPNISLRQNITIVINNTSSQSQSFVIMNYNEQK